MVCGRACVPPLFSPRAPHRDYQGTSAQTTRCPDLHVHGRVHVYTYICHVPCDRSLSVLTSTLTVCERRDRRPTRLRVPLAVHPPFPIPSAPLLDFILDPVICPISALHRFTCDLMKNARALPVPKL